METPKLSVDRFQNKSPNDLVDRFGRKVSYVRISITDRCDFRCTYCMSKNMKFLPRKNVLSLEEIHFIVQAFVQLGVKKARITGGEPLVRNNAISLFQSLGSLENLEQLVMTTNGAQLEKFARPLFDAGVSRVNVSLDSLRKERFKSITRTGDLGAVLKGLEAASNVGFEKVKINTVIMSGKNEDEILDLLNFAKDNHFDISFIEEMPLGNISDHKREETFFSSDRIFKIIDRKYPLTPDDNKIFTKQSISDGPSKYFTLSDSPTKVGFISPHSHNFCSSCNRVRVTAEGRLLLCLGNEHSVDLRAVLRQYPGEMDKLESTIINAMDLKPERHYFNLAEEPQIVRFMSQTGG